jgi:hypothetical protein
VEHNQNDFSGTRQVLVALMTGVVLGLVDRVLFAYRYGAPRRGSDTTYGVAGRAGHRFPQHETERRVREIIKRLPERKPG